MKTTNVKTNRKKKTFGQQERYSHVTKSIFNERLKCKDGAWLRNIDITMEEPKMARKVRRIIEKRMCQTYHRQHKDTFHEYGNHSRHNMKRAISYELYILGQIEDVTNRSRDDSTHWKVYMISIRAKWSSGRSLAIRLLMKQRPQQLNL